MNSILDESNNVYALAENASPGLSTSNNSKEWQMFVSLYLWLAGLNGDIGIGQNQAAVDVSFGDIWENFDVGGQAHIEFWWKKWIFYVAPTYIKLTSSNSQTRVISTIRSDAEVKLFQFEFAGGYRVAEFPLGSSVHSNQFKTWPNLSVDLYGGGRIISIDSTLDVTIDTPIGVIPKRFQKDETWFDFIVGTRLLIDITENLLLVTRSDIGGFGFGFSSDISWNFIANIGYTLPWWNVTPYIGYRVLYIDYDDGSGSDRFLYNVWQTGPQVGIGVRF